MCKKADLITKARKLLCQENLFIQDYKLKKLQIKLTRLEDEQKTKYQLKDLRIKLTRLHENKLNNVKTTTITSTHTNGDAIFNIPNDFTASPKNGTVSDDTEIYELAEQTNGTDSDDTEIYELTEQTIGTVMILDKKTAILHTDDHRAPFRCPEKSCNIRLKKWKDINGHYKAVHMTYLECKICKVKYSTSYGLKQHMYVHLKMTGKYMCRKCNKSFSFRSQQKIHLLSHTRNPKYECAECFQMYKSKHDMLKHKKEHYAPEIKCHSCEYTGTLLKLKEHSKQHNPKYHLQCNRCLTKFIFSMSFWCHKRKCRPQA